MKKWKGTKGEWTIFHHSQSNTSGLKCVGTEDGITMLEAKGVEYNHFTVCTGSRSHDKVKSNVFGSWIGHHVCELTYPPNGMARGYAEAKANAELIADAGTTMNKCGIMPSELLEQRNGLLEACKEALEAFEIYVKDGYIMKGTKPENMLIKAISKCTGK